MKKNEKNKNEEEKEQSTSNNVETNKELVKRTKGKGKIAKIIAWVLGGIVASGSSAIGGYNYGKSIIEMDNKRRTEENYEKKYNKSFREQYEIANVDITPDEFAYYINKKDVVVFGSSMVSGLAEYNYITWADDLEPNIKKLGVGGSTAGHYKFNRVEQLAESDVDRKYILDYVIDEKKEEYSNASKAYIQFLYNDMVNLTFDVIDNIKYNNMELDSAELNKNSEKYIGDVKGKKAKLDTVNRHSYIGGIEYAIKKLKEENPIMEIVLLTDSPQKPGNLCLAKQAFEYGEEWTGKSYKYDINNDGIFDKEDIDIIDNYIVKYRDKAIEKMEALAKEYNCEFINLYNVPELKKDGEYWNDDNIHLNKKGNNIVRKYVQELENKKEKMER